MFIVDFRNKQVSKYCFSVMNNNDVDIVHFYSHFTQYQSYLCYLKVESEDMDYVDEILIDPNDISVSDNALLVKWTMGKVSTQCKKINVQLEFRENDTETAKVAQTNIVSLVLNDTINVEEKIIPIYPDVLKRMQEEIDERVVKTHTHDKVYCTDGSGNQTTKDIGAMAGEGSVPVRAESGHLQVPATNETSFPYYAVSYKYANDELAKKVPYSGATQDVDLGSHKLTTYAFEVKRSDDNFMRMGNGVITLRTSEGTRTFEFPMAVYSGGVDTIASREWVESLGYVPYTGATRSLDLGANSFIARTVEIKTNNDNYLRFYGDGNLTVKDTTLGMRLFKFPAQTGDDRNTFATQEWTIDQIATIKRNAFIDVDTNVYPTLEDFLETTGEEGFLYLYPIDTTDLSKGYYQYIWESNLWLCLGTTVIDLSNYYTKTEADNRYVAKTGDQVINGKKEFVSGVYLQNGAKVYFYDLNNNEYYYGLAYEQGNVIIGSADLLAVKFLSQPLPYSSNTYDLGSSSLMWKDLYLIGDIRGANAGQTDFYYGTTKAFTISTNVAETRSLYPQTNGAYTLGSIEKKYTFLYLSQDLVGVHWATSIDNIVRKIDNAYEQDNSRTEINYYVTSVISLSANRTFTLMSPMNTGFMPVYKAILTNTASSPITITLPSGTKILTNNDEDVVISNNTFQLGAGITAEVNIMNNNAVVVVF